MKFEFFIIGITGLIVYNTYYDNFIVKCIETNKKYIQIAGYMFVALSIYSYMKKNPNNSRGLVESATNFIKHMPIDNSATSAFAPFMDFTQSMQSSNNTPPIPKTPQTKRMLQSGGTNSDINKRCVSQSKKKFIAAQQSWRCGHCNQQLDHTYEVDHVLDLQYGGSNQVDNLIALCRNCHGKKTMNSKI